MVWGGFCEGLARVTDSARHSTLSFQTAIQGFEAEWTPIPGPAECAERSAAPPQVGRACWIQSKILAKEFQTVRCLASNLGQISIPPLYLSPGPRTFRRAGLKFAYHALSDEVFSIFRLPKNLANLATKNQWNKCENRGFWLPKTVPKSFQNASENDVPTKM